MKKESIEIETPEKIIFTYNISSTGTRIFAYTIDVIIQIVVVVLLILLVSSTGLFSFSLSSDGFSRELNGLLIAFAFLLYFFIQWGYFIVFEVIMEGQSPGKKIMKIRVIRTNGEPLDLPTIILRNLLRAVDAFPFYHLVGGLVSIVDSRSRRIGDIVSDTIVVKEMIFNLKEPNSFTVFLTSGKEGAFSFFNKKLNEEDLYILRRFLNEKGHLSKEKQDEIALKLAQSIKKRLQIQEEIENPLVFIERVYRGHIDENKE
ncbi:MAG: RDD family protein [Spirochaetales bacterium]|nr:RDD family protein [Spirochaetales bacterium]